MTDSLSLRRQAGCRRLKIARCLGVALTLALLVSLALSGEASAGNVVNFAAPVSTTLPANPRSVAVGDFNQDGFQDLAITSDASDLVTIRVGSAGGAFSTAGTVPVAAGTRAAVVAIGDFNADGDPDLAVTNFGGNTVSIALGGAGATFAAPNTFAVGSSPVGIAVGDFNGDSRLDLVVTNQGSDNVSILLGAGSGRFTGPTNFNVGDGPGGVADGPDSVAVADFNADGILDLAVTNKDSNRVSILTGVPGAAGTFSAPTNIAVGSFPVSVAVGDFNGDKDPDLAVANENSSTVSILVGGLGAGFTLGSTLTGGARAVAVADFNLDGDPDLAVGSSSGISVFVGSAAATFGGAQSFAAGGTVEDVAAADFDKDGKPDLAAANYFAPQGVSVLLNTTDLTPPDTTITAGPTGLTNDNTPTFSFTSTEAGSTFQCRVDTAAFAACTSPSTTAALADGAHTFEVRAIDAAGNVDATPASRGFTVDTNVPDTTITAGPSGPTNTTTPTFSFTSNELGVSFQCRVDTAAFAACSSPFTTAALAQGAHTFEVRAVDAAGNVDATPASQSFTVDTVAPDTTIAAGPSGPTNTTTPAFTFSSNEAGGSFQCRVDTAAFAACSSPFTTAALAQGAHTFEVRAVDAAGNVDATPASRSFTVDTVAPDTTITAGPSGPTNTNTPTFSFTATEAGSTFQCRVDTAAFAACNTPFTTAALAQGAHTFEVRAVDAAGNVDATPASRSFSVDTNVPDTTITAGPSGPTNTTTPTFSFTSNKAGSTFECRVDTAAFTACNTPFTTAALAQGAHTFEVRAVDPVGNVDATPASRSFTVDTVAPDTTITAGPSGQTTDDTPTFEFSSSEAGSTFECRVDTGAFASCTSPHTTAVLAQGDHTFDVRATDAAGNVDATVASRSFTVSAPAAADTTPPETVITAGPSGTTADRTPTFEFSSNEPGSRFECQLDASPFIPCTSPFTLPPLTPGPHTFQVRAIDAAGNVDPSPASSTDPKAALRAFTVVAAEPPPPVLGKSFNVEPVSGEVLVSEPPSGAARASAAVPGIKGRNFIPLQEAKQVPVGSILDTRKGTARLTSAKDSKGSPQTGEFTGGVFQVLQSGKRSERGLTELRLKGLSFAACRGAARGKKASAARSRLRVRRLRGSAKGRFRTRGRYAAATVRGTIWTVTDRCDGTLTKVTRGVVAVRDLRKHKTVLVRTGKSYLARAP